MHILRWLLTFLSLCASGISDWNEPYSSFVGTQEEGGSWLTCVVQNPQLWGDVSQKKWSGPVNGCSELKKHLGEHFNMTVSHVQYFDEQCNAYIDLDDEYNSWNDFMLQTYKRLSVRHEPMADGIGTRPSNHPQNETELTKISGTDLEDQDGSPSDFYEGESVKQVVRLACSIPT